MRHDKILKTLCSDFIIIKSGRKAKQKARKLAKQNPTRFVQVVTKNNNIVYCAHFDGCEVFVCNYNQGLIQK